MQTVRRKPDVDLFWPICGALLLVTFGIVAFFILSIAKPGYASAQPACKPQAMIVADALEQGGEVFLIDDAEEVKRGKWMIAENDGTPLEGADTIVFSVFPSGGTAEIVFVKAGMACGYMNGTYDDGMKWYEFVKTKAGRPA